MSTLGLIRFCLHISERITGALKQSRRQSDSLKRPLRHILTLKAYSSLYLLSTIALGVIACESPAPKSLEDVEWTEFGIYEVPDMNPSSAGEIITLAGSTTMGGVTAGDALAGVDAGELGGELGGASGGESGGELGGEPAGEPAGTSAGEIAGEMSSDDIAEDPSVAFEDAVIPARDHVALWDRGHSVTLLWSAGASLWASASTPDGTLRAPRKILEHTAAITMISAHPLGRDEQGGALILSDEVGDGYALSLTRVEQLLERSYTGEATEESAGGLEQSSADDLTLIALPLRAPLKSSSQRGELLIVGSVADLEGAEPRSHTGWMSLDEHTLETLSALEVSSAEPGEAELAREALVELAPSGWPIPDEIGWVSGRALLRFNEVGQCAYLTATLEIDNSAPCEPGRGYLLSAASESLLAHILPTGQLQVTQAASPNLESSYPVAQLDLSEAESGGARPSRGPYRSSARELTLIGRRLSEESDGLIRDRLITLDPLGMWVSKRGWDAWPYEGARAFTRRGRSAWGYVFDEEHAPRRIVVPLQVNTFIERAPFGLSVDLSCRPSVERCDELDNDCDGVVDNGLCCATGRAPFEAYFIPTGTPSELFVTDVEAADSSRYAIRVGESRWEIWAAYYGASSRNLYSLGVIEGAGDAAGFTAAGDYTVLVARDEAGEWRAFWSHIVSDSPRKEPELLNCDEVLAVSNVGYSPTSTSAVALCSDRVVHLRADLSESGELIPSETYTEPFANLPAPRWGTMIRHSSRGEASFLVAFESLTGSWEVRKVSVAKGTGNRLTFTPPSSLNGKLDLNGVTEPSPIYLHRDDSPGVPGELTYLEISSERTEAHVSAILSGERVWSPLVFGEPVDQIQYTEMPSKIVASAPHSDHRGANFYVIDFKEYRLSPNLWATQPAFSWRAPLIDSETSETSETEASDETASPRLIWSLIHGNYYNYIATLFDAGEEDSLGNPLPRGAWAIRLYSVTNCER